MTVASTATSAVGSTERPIEMESTVGAEPGTEIRVNFGIELGIELATELGTKSGTEVGIEFGTKFATGFAVELGAMLTAESVGSCGSAFGGSPKIASQASNDVSDGLDDRSFSVAAGVPRGGDGVSASELSKLGKPVASDPLFVDVEATFIELTRPFAPKRS